jgi:hypothetical protein
MTESRSCYVTIGDRITALFQAVVADPDIASKLLLGVSAGTFNGPHKWLRVVA